MFYFFLKKYNFYFLNNFDFLFEEKRRIDFKSFLIEFSRSLKEKNTFFFVCLSDLFDKKRKRLLSIGFFLNFIKNNVLFNFRNEIAKNLTKLKDIKFPFYFFFVKFFTIDRLNFLNLADQFFLVFKLRNKRIRYFFSEKFFKIKERFLLLDFLNFLKIRKRKEKKINLRKRLGKHR